jgi:iron complex outermembrane receptor protein
MAKQVLAVAAAAVCLLAPTLARAQDADDIIVTADKRGDSIAQILPLALSVFDADALAARNVEDLQSLSYTMPNVQLEDIGTARGIANFTIRGLGVNSSIIATDPAVGVFVDGIYQGVNAGSITEGFDLEAVEVLRGPQGALYGRNVTGGAVLVRTRRPTDVFEARARVAYETGPNIITEAVVSGPLAPGVLSGRFGVYHADDDGWFENDYDGSSFGENRTDIYRGALRFTPTRDLEFILRAEQGYMDGDGPAGQNHALHDGGNFGFAIDNPGYAGIDWEQATLETNWRVAFGDGVITNIWGWRSVDVPWAADIDSTANFVFHTRVLNTQEQWSNELRYAGSFGPADLVAGLYYFEQDILYIDERNFGPSGFRRVGGGQGEFSTAAAFATIDWRLAEGLTLSTGARYTHEEKDARTSRVRAASDDLDGALTPIGEGIIGGDIDARTLNFSDEPYALSWNDLSPHVGLQWRVTDDTNLYLNWSRAFRSGGVNFRVATLGTPTLAQPARTYDAEEVEAWEFGWKQDFERGRLNLAIFHNAVDNMQRETNVPGVSGVQQTVLNAGDATLWGGEIEAVFALTERVTIAAFAGYTHGEYEDVREDLNGDLLVNEADLALEIPRVAPWSYGASVEYGAPFASGELAARVAYNHRDAAVYNDANTGVLAEADIIDARLAYTPSGERWSLAVYGENLTDEVTWGGDTVLPSTADFGYSGGALPTFSPLNKGRVLGVELRFEY